MNETDWEPKIVAFACSWCASLAADLAGTGRNTYPDGVRIVRVPCVGRIDPLYVTKALQNGADGVLIYGCHPKDCHHYSGNAKAKRKFALLKRFLVFVGLEPERVQIAWVTASEGTRFADVANRVVADVKKLGPAGNFLKVSQ